MESSLRENLSVEHWPVKSFMAMEYFYDSIHTHFWSTQRAYECETIQFHEDDLLSDSLDRHFITKN